MELYKDIINAPHTLIAGTTGSGKSNVMNGIIRQIMTDYTPQTAEMVMIDPKVVELIDYRNTAFCTAFESEAENVPALLDEVIDTMETRYRLMGEEHIKQYSGRKIFVIVDELADLMISPQSKSIKLKLQKILQKGRAADIHIIAATQAPNRQIIPANLILNFTNRLALRCVSSIESRQIINQAGAELLPQYGKGLYFSPKGLVTVSIQLTEDNTELVNKWTVRKPVKAEPKAEIEEAEEDRVIYIAAPKDYSEPRHYDPNRTADIIRNIGLAIGGIGFVLAMLA